MIADLILAAVVILSVFIGYKVGFIKSFLNLFFMLFSAVGCYLLYPFVAEIIIATPIGENINTYFSEMLSEKYLNMDKEGYLSLLLKYNAQTVEELIEKLADLVSLLAVNIISAVAVFILIRLIFMLIKGVFGFITKIPVINVVNGVLGAFLSVTSSIIVIYLFFAVILSPPCNTTEFSYKVCKEVDESIMAKNVMNYNVFINYDTTKATLQDE